MAALKLVFVTGNANKLREVKKILCSDISSDASLKIEVESKALDLPEIQGSTQDVAREKSKAAAKLIGGPCITEDTALCFKAMGDLPGPYIKWFLEKLGLDGLNTMLEGFKNKEATALCTFAYCEPDKDPILFEGATQGTIVPPRGPTNFGWDPIFEVVGTGLTYAEMSSEQKNGLSHRSKALDKLRRHFSNLQ
ncbi:hypothetical protein MJO28_004878 [Puccinia striiformis f. sp. tritici]|uniref:Uncharacterized protein n=1 Tax=Puccinia striiformis f. sp. tritici TaxID=168172 RepID=A0ACC0EL00_9BASI|nr:uncharacterized protein Pst134EA_031662 [Puccinia striiformis f. sp. tritici]KAH9442693.1 hypothetical protein Pst134EA_031662 [Puccinia striiformis f. sp. tritici]KAH9457810.1 hypothetical protein Pst134EB_010122 [Puccinia striiformis f. sp. tritici]KAI7954478.1 hypothetical protein MJO28_004878 [Puccinia striiformis f. sp. tritici]